MSEGRYRRPSDLPFFAREPKLEIDIKTPDGETQAWLINPTTQRRCVDAWGDETKAWIGKALTITRQTMLVNGVSRNVLFGDPILRERSEGR